MARNPRRATAAPPNLAARALGSKLFGQRVVTPKKGYSRKVKHRKGSSSELPFFMARHAAFMQTPVISALAAHNMV